MIVIIKFHQLEEKFTKVKFPHSRQRAIMAFETTKNYTKKKRGFEVNPKTGTLQKKRIKTGIN